jgi:hypothetical protein
MRRDRNRGARRPDGNWWWPIAAVGGVLAVVWLHHTVERVTQAKARAVQVQQQQRPQYPAAPKMSPAPQLQPQTPSAQPQSRPRLDRTAEYRRILAQLEDTCRYWLRKGNATMAESACRRMREHSVQAGLPIPQVPQGRQAYSTSTTRTTTSPPVRVNQCTNHAHGSIDYRQCRAAEKERLRKACARAREHARGKVGQQYLLAKQHADAVCVQFERYAIVR